MSVLTTPENEASWVYRSAGMIVKVVPESKTAGETKALVVRAMLPFVGSLRARPVQETVKEVKSPFTSGWIGSAAKVPWNLSVSIPPKRTEPVEASVWGISDLSCSRNIRTETYVNHLTKDYKLEN